MNNQDIKNLIAKYLNGTATKAETYVVETWLESFQNDDDDVSHLKISENQALLEKRIVAKATQQGKAKKYSLWPKIGIAAAILCVPLITLLTANFQPKTNVSLSYRKYVTGINQFKKISLPDSTVVFLNSNSVLEVLNDFNAHPNREVKLNGEAFFEVSKDQHRPFKIALQKLSVQVLGTSFNINAPALNKEIKVAVKTGKVLVKNEKKLLGTLTANEQIVFDKKSQSFKVSVGEDVAKALWREGVYVLDKATFDELSTVVYNIYGISLKTEERDLLAERYYFTIRSSRTLTQTLNQISEMTKRKHRKEGNSIVIF